MRKPRLFGSATVVLVSLLGVITCTAGPGPTEIAVPADSRPHASAPALLTAEPPAIFVGAGDISKCTNNDDEKTAQLLDALPGVPVFTLGDNVYASGTAAEFTNCYEPSWGRHKPRTHPAPGNTEYVTSGAQPYYDYFGAAAGTPGQGYYSFDLGQWHIIALNSAISRTPTSPQMQWLRADLAAHPNLCTLAYWHHPLYSSVSGTGSGGATFAPVRPLWDTLYAYGADLVLGGHRHSYERIAPIKPDGSADNAFGIRTIIAGTGGVGGITFTNVFPRSEQRNGATRGVLKLYLYPDSYAWKFIPIAGKTYSDSGSTTCHSPPGVENLDISASLSTISAAPASITAGSGASTITVTARGPSGNPVSGASVVLSATGTGNSLTQPIGRTDAGGVATGTFGSSDPGVKVISASANGTSLTQTAEVTVAPAGVAAITQTLLTSGNSVLNQSTYTTAGISPAPNALVTIALLSHRSTTTISPIVTGGGMTSWTLVASVDFDTLNLPHRRLSIYRALNPAPESGPITFKFTNQVSNLEWIISQWGGVETSGENGAGAIVQSGSARADAGTGLSVALAPFSDPNNVALGAFGVNSQVLAITPGAGFTEIDEQPAAEGTRGDLQTQWAVDRNLVGASWPNLKGGALGVEIRARTGP